MHVKGNTNDYPNVTVCCQVFAVFSYVTIELIMATLYSFFINELRSVIRNSNTLMYADDVEIFLSFNNNKHQVLVQDDIN